MPPTPVPGSYNSSLRVPFYGVQNQRGGQPAPEAGTSSRPLLYQGSNSRFVTPILTPNPSFITPFSSFVNSANRVGVRPSLPEIPIRSTAPAVELLYVQKTSSHPESARGDSRGSRRHGSSRLFYSLLVLLQLLVLAFPITTLLLVQAILTSRPLQPYIISFVLITASTLAILASAAVLWTNQRRRQRQVQRKDKQEIEKWKMLAREKSREVEVAGWAAERLRGNLRSLSRGRSSTKTESKRGSLVEERPRTASIDCRGGCNVRKMRSVSRGRTGRGMAEHGVWELEGVSVTSPKSEQVTSPKLEQARRRGSVARGREAAMLLQQRTAEAAKRRRAESDAARAIRDLNLNKPLPLPPLRLPKVSRNVLKEISAAAAPRSDHRSLTASPDFIESSASLVKKPQRLPNNLTKEFLLPTYQPPVLGQPTVVQTQQYSPGQDSNEGDPAEENVAILSVSTAEDAYRRIARQASGLVHQPHNDPDDGTSTPEERDEGIPEGSCSNSESDEVLEIMRGGHGTGSTQSDENFETNHALGEDAMSMTDSLKAAKRAASLRKVRPWQSSSAVAILPQGQDIGTAGKGEDYKEKSHWSLDSDDVVPGPKSVRSKSDNSKGGMEERRRGFLKHLVELAERRE